jgi:hypothetical protein
MFVRDALGRAEEVHHLGRANEPVCLRTGGSIFRLLKDERGRISEASLLGVDRKPAASGLVSSLKFVYDGFGRPSAIMWFGIDGKPTVGADGVFEARKSYGEDGRVIRRDFFDAKGRPMLCRAGYASMAVSYSKGGAAESSVILDKHGNVSPIRLSRGGIVRWSRDERGSVTAIENFDADGSPVLIAAGYHRLWRQFDGTGRLLSQSTHGVNGDLVEGLDGVAVHEYQYDDVGNVEWIRRLGAGRNPVAGEGGWSASRTRYDQMRRPVRVDFFDTDGAPLAGGIGPAYLTRTFNELGDCVEERYHGVDGRLTMNGMGISMSRATWNERRQRVSFEVFAASGVRASDKNGISRTLWKFDDDGRELERRYFGPDDGPVCGQGGAHRISLAYDGEGRVVRELRFGIDGGPACTPGSPAGIVYRYDNLGRQASTTYLGKDHLPDRVCNGFCRIDREFDWAGQVVREQYFDEKGAPAFTAEGFSGMTREYDDLCREVREAVVDERGGRVVSSNGYCIAEARHDRLGRVIEIRRLGAGGEPALDVDGIHRITFTLDVKGNRVEELQFDLLGRPAAGTDGAAARRRRFDQLGRCTAELSIGPDLSLLDAPGLFAQRAWLHDSKGEIFRELRFIAASKDQLEPRPHSVICFTRDAAGRIVEQWTETAEGDPMPDQTGVFRKRTTYDCRGLQVRTESTDASGQSAVATVPFATVRSYDDFGRLIRISYLNSFGQPVAGQDGCHSLAYRFDESGNLVSERCEDGFGNPEGRVGALEGVCEIRHRYNDRRLCIELSSYGAGGELACPPGKRAAVYCSEFDQFNRLVSRSAFGASRERVGWLPHPSKGVDSVHRYEVEFDEFFHTLEFRQFDEAGVRIPPP